MHPGLIKTSNQPGKKLKRSQIREICEQLGHNPSDVVEIRILPKSICVQRLSYDRAGNIRMDTFGAITSDAYHSIEEDEHLDDQAPDGAGGGGMDGPPVGVAHPESTG